MGRIDSCLRWRIISSCFVVFTLSLVFFTEPLQAITAAIGQPYHGRLVNGIPFPTQFPGYQLREENKTRTTPEVIGAVLDAIDGVREKYPDTCDLYLGDFTIGEGGPASHHRSHQNGRDVDMGLYAKGNRRLDSLHVMNESNLDAAKTWLLMEGLIRSQRVQYIFMDRSVQRIIYEYALSHGVDRAYLDQLFSNSKGSLVKHVPNHVDHMHVRFFTPWSTLAAHIGESETQKRTVIEMAQQAYLPKRVNYYVQGTESSIDSLAKSFGVTGGDLCRWNQIRGNTVLPPGSCLVFYKRNFEAEPVQLAQSLQPYSTPLLPPVRLASLRPVSAPSAPEIVTDASAADEEQAPKETKRQSAQAPASTSRSTYKVRSGDTLDKIARSHGMDPSALRKMNDMNRSAKLRRGQVIKLASAKSESSVNLADVPSCDISAMAGSRKSSKNRPLDICTVNRGDTLDKVAKRNSLSIKELCKLNGLRKSARLQPGQKLNLSRPEPVARKSGRGAEKAPALKSGKQSASSKSVASNKKGVPVKAAVSSKVSTRSDSKAAKAAPTSGRTASKSVKETKTANKTVSKSAAPAKNSKAPAKTASKAATVASAKASTASKPAAKAVGKVQRSVDAGAKQAMSSKSSSKRRVN